MKVIPEIRSAYLIFTVPKSWKTKGSRLAKVTDREEP
jgi:hypothetical protein